MAPTSPHLCQYLLQSFKDYFSPNEYNTGFYCGYDVENFCICSNWDICLYANLGILNTRPLEDTKFVTICSHSVVCLDILYIL